MELKRLGFVTAYTSWLLDLASSVYGKSKEIAPGFTKPYIVQAEETVQAYGAPLYSKMLDVSGSALETADGLTDYALNTLNGALNFSRDLHEKNMKAFNYAKDSYYGWLESVVERVKAVLNPWPYAQWGFDTAKWFTDKVALYVDPDKIVDRVSQATTYPPVARALEAGEPVIKPVEAQLKKGHHYLVTNSGYGKLYTNIEKTRKTLGGSPLYRRARDTVWPIAEPLAGPLYNNFASSKYLAQLSDQMKPKVA